MVNTISTTTNYDRFFTALRLFNQIHLSMLFAAKLFATSESDSNNLEDAFDDEVDDADVELDEELSDDFVADEDDIDDEDDLDLGAFDDDDEDDAIDYEPEDVDEY